MTYDPNNPQIFDEEGNVYSLSRRTDYENRRPDPDDEVHTHEFLGSTTIDGPGMRMLHNHRFAGVTTGEIPIRGGNHIHGFEANTDSFGHFHEIAGNTGPAIVLNPQAPRAFQVHVHLARGTTTDVNGHTHNFVFGTLIESPLSAADQRNDDCDDMQKE